MSANPAGNPAGEINWLLDTLVGRVAEVQRAVVLSSDGLLVGASSGLTREEGERLAAVSASFQSLARSAGRQFGGGAVRQTVIEMEMAYLFVTAAGSGACLAVLASGDADVGLVAYEMAMLVNRVGRHMASLPRSAVDS